MTSDHPASAAAHDDGLLLLTPEEAARRLSIGRTRLYALLRTGELASIQIGGSRRVSPDALRHYVERIAATTNPRHQHQPGRSQTRASSQLHQPDGQGSPPGRDLLRHPPVAPPGHNDADRYEVLHLPFAIDR